MKYNYCGNSGILLPVLSLGLWHNFGSVDPYEQSREMLLKAFDNGICHFDLANNYGPEPGSAEANFGRILREDLAAHRDEMFISTKAGHAMWHMLLTARPRTADAKVFRRHSAQQPRGTPHRIPETGAGHPGTGGGSAPTPRHSLRARADTAADGTGMASP